jgi:L-amino acid N-acyltransferase YncA
MQIRPMQNADWPRVAEIYEEGLATGQATFETTVPSFEQWDAVHLPTSRLVVDEDGDVIGWGALIPVSKRPVYKGVAEASVYIAKAHRGSGIGGELLDALIESSENEGIWTLQASVFPENEASLLLLQSRRFRMVGNRVRIARHNGRWRDTVLLERRSTRVGV